MLPLAATMGNPLKDEIFEDDDSQSSDDESSSEEEEEESPPTTVVTIVIKNKKTERNELFRVLLDSGSNRCIGTKAAIQRAGLKSNEGQGHKYKTAAGTFTTTHQAKIRAHNLLELNSKRKLLGLKVQVTESELGLYDFIFGRDYMKRYGIDLLFSEEVIQWDGMRMAMKRPEDLKMDLTEVQQLIEDEDREGTSSLEENCDCIYAQQIMDAKYEKQDLLRVTQDQKHLDKEQRDLLHALLSKFADLFAGELGTWPDEEISVELTKDAVPYHCGKPIRIPHIHLETLKKEVQRLVDIGVLEVVDGSKAGPWCAPSFIIPKKDNTARFITDYRELNKRIRRKPWPMPHITDLLQDVGQYKYVTALDLSMGYYHFRLNDELSDMSTFMLPFGIFKYR